MTTTERPTEQFENCGTYGGFRKHRRYQQAPCPACAQAGRDYQNVSNNRRRERNNERNRVRYALHGRPDRIPRSNAAIKLDPRLSPEENLRAHILRAYVIGDKLIDLDAGNCNVDNSRLFDGLREGETRKELFARRRQAEKLCATCPVRQQCADWAATWTRSRREHVHLPEAVG